MGKEIASLFATIGVNTAALQKGLTDAKTKFSTFKTQINDATRAVTGFDASTIASAAGIGVIVREYQKAINETMTYAKQVRDLSRAIGETPEDISKLIQAADDVQVEFGQLETSLIYGAKNGIDVSINGLMDLSEQYLAIQDPLERVKFLTDNFGRSGADMGAFMEMGAAGIQAAGEEAEKYGRILDESAIAQTEKFRIAQDNLDDSMSKLKDTLALEVMPALTDLLGFITPVITAYNSLKDAVNGLDPALKEITTSMYVFLDPVKAILGPIYALIEAFKGLKEAMAGAGGVPTSIVKPTVTSGSTPIINGKAVDFSSGKYAYNSTGQLIFSQTGQVVQSNHAIGADFIVPPGFPNDSYRMGVQSGERVKVEPASKVMETGKQAGIDYDKMASTLVYALKRAGAFA